MPMRKLLSFTVLLTVLFLTSCVRYYRVTGDNVEVHETFTDGSKVLFTLNSDEVVYTNVELGPWGSVYRTDGSGQKGWVRTSSLERMESDMEDSLSVAAREAKKLARQTAEERRIDSIKATKHTTYYRITADSVELYSRDMSTKLGRKEGKKISSLEQGRRVGTREEGKAWLYVFAADDIDDKSGYMMNAGLERLSKAENDSLNNVRAERTIGLVFKGIHPTMVYVCIAMALLALVPFVWMWRQQRQRNFIYLSLLWSYGGAIIVTLFAAARMDGSLNFLWCYRILPAAIATLIVYPLLYTDLTQKQMRKIANIVYWLLVPICFVFYADYQDGLFWMPVKMYLLNAFAYLYVVSMETYNKCPHCGMYADHTDAGTTYDGRMTESSTRNEHHAGESRVEREYEGGHLVKETIYKRPDYWVKKVSSTTFDVFSHHKSCIRCGMKFVDSREKKVV